MSTISVYILNAVSISTSKMPTGEPSSVVGTVCTFSGPRYLGEFAASQFTFNPRLHDGKKDP